MSLAIGQTIRAELQNRALTVRRKLGEGTQGAVFLVEGGTEQLALKWYTAVQATEDQKAAVRALVGSGPPQGVAGRRFVWPLDLAVADGQERFGYLMPLIDRERFLELGELWADPRRYPLGYPAMCEASYQLANSFRALHLSGYCYRDISRGNLLFDHRSGDVLICDNDNVGIDRQSECQVLGTLENMAPEVVRLEAKPSTLTDLHGLAVLLFQLWNCHHPLEGEQEYRYRSWDALAKREVYGKAPFIHDPKDVSNRLPADPNYNTARKRWQEIPASLRSLFTRAFTEGLRDANRRVTEGEWQHLFLQLRDGVIPCPGCRAENLWDAPAASLVCWHCKQPVPLPPKLRFTHPAGQHWVLLTRSARVLRRHVQPSVREEDAREAVGEMAQNPADPRVWGLRNLTGTNWRATYPDGSVRDIEPQRAAPLSLGLRLDLPFGASATVEA